MRDSRLVSVERGSNRKFVTVSRQFSALADMIRRDGFERLLTSYFLTSLIFPSLLDYNLLELDGEAFLKNYLSFKKKVGSSSSIIELRLPKDEHI